MDTNNQTSPNCQQSTEYVRESCQNNTFQHIQMQSELKIAKILTRVCLAIGVVTLIGTLYIIIGPATYPRQYSRQELALIFSLSYTIYDIIKIFGTTFCVGAMIAIAIVKSRYKIRIKRLLITVICSVLMIYLLSIMNGITFYTHYPDYGTYPFFCNFSHF